MRDVLGKTVKLAVFRNIEPGGCLDGYETIDGENFERASGYVRTSEYVEITFQKLKDELVIDKYIEALDRSERQIRLDFQKKLDEIAGQRASLLALTHKPA
jgi:hypothetical protein